MQTNQGFNYMHITGVSQQNNLGVQSQQFKPNNFGQYNLMGFTHNNPPLSLEKVDSMENKKNQFPYILGQNNVNQNNMYFMNNQNFINQNNINNMNMNNQIFMNPNNINNMNNQNMFNQNTMDKINNQNMLNKNNMNNINNQNVMNKNSMNNINDQNVMNLNNMNNINNQNVMNKNSMNNINNQNVMNLNDIIQNNNNNNFNLNKNSMQGNNNMNINMNLNGDMQNNNMNNVNNFQNQNQPTKNPFFDPQGLDKNIDINKDNKNEQKESKNSDISSVQNSLKNPKNENTPSEKNNSNQIDNNNNNNININNDNNDKEIMNQISENHIKILSNYYVPSEPTSHLNNLLKDMDNFGEITKNNIEREKASNPYKFISAEEALSFNDQDNLTDNGMNPNYNNNPKNDFFILSLLKKALENEGCTCEIERDLPQINDEKIAYTTVQFIVNGMYKFKKYIFTFDFGSEMNDKMFNNQAEQNKFNGMLIYNLISLLELSPKDIVITNPRKGPYIITAIIKKSNFKELSETELFNKLMKKQEYKGLQKVEKSILLSGCKLNRIMLDNRGDRSSGWGVNELRGGKPYNPPIGWIGFGLRVLDRYDNGDNTWLDYLNKPGEWSVAYHGIGASLSGQVNLNNVNNLLGNINMMNTVIRQQYKEEMDKYHQGEKVGEGVYMTQFPNVMEQFCNVCNIQGKKFKIGIMCRVMPDKIRCPTSRDDYWVINGTDNEVRPYRILIKEVM